MEFSQQKVLRNCFRVNGWMCSSASYVLQYAGTPYNKCAIWLPSDEYSYRCRTAFHNVRVHTRRLAASKLIHLSSSSHFCSLGQFRLLIVAKMGNRVFSYKRECVKSHFKNDETPSVPWFMHHCLQQMQIRCPRSPPILRRGIWTESSNY